MSGECLGHWFPNTFSLGPYRNLGVCLSPPYNSSVYDIFEFWQLNVTTIVNKWRIIDLMENNAVWTLNFSVTNISNFFFNECMWSLPKTGPVFRRENLKYMNYFCQEKESTPRKSALDFAIKCKLVELFPFKLIIFF